MGAVPCAACGHGMRAAAKFCDECGASARSAERKHVTVLFGDVVGSMKLAAMLDLELLREIMYALSNRSALIVQRYGGTVDKFPALHSKYTPLQHNSQKLCISSTTSTCRSASG